MQRVRSPFTVTYTGGFDAHRGLETVLEAMPVLTRLIPGIRLVLVGGGRTEPDLRVLAQRLGVQESVWFAGWQSPDLLKSFIVGSDVCIVPHLRTPHTDATLPRLLLPRAALTFVLLIFLKNLKNDVLADLYRLSNDGNSLSASYSGNGTLTFVPSPFP